MYEKLLEAAGVEPAAGADPDHRLPLVDRLDLNQRLQGVCTDPVFRRRTSIQQAKSWSGQQDSNLRPHAPKARALAKLSYAPKIIWLVVILRETDIPTN